ncbi:MAG: hypothetical protein ACI8P0_005405 [Planctomycetaceae bacterium]
MDALFFFRHSSHDDFEIQHALRGVARHMPWIRKVWVFGDRPRFLSEDTSLVEHVPHEYVARVGKHRTPITSFFMMYYLSSLIPDLDFEYLWFCDDFFPIGDLSIEEARKDRYIVNMDDATRGTGLWNESLWRTYDFLKRLGYTGYNFETHAPTYFTKKRVFEAYCDFKDFVTQDRWYGMLGPTAILNHAVCRDSVDLVHRGPEGRWVGFYGQAPPYEEFLKKVDGKTFLNCDDRGLTDVVRRYLRETFPEPCQYEQPTDSTTPVPALPLPTGTTRDFRMFPEVILPDRSALPEYFNDLKLSGEGVEIGVLRGGYSEKLLDQWNGRKLHCVDPWSDSTEDDSYVDRNNVNQKRHDQNHQQAVDRLARFGDRCEIHRMTSVDAIELFEDRSLDFVYIDARHYREAVLEDLESWFPKVRPGGVLAGHDYFDGVVPSGHFEVKSTVDEWADAKGLKVACTGENVWRSWIVQLPEAIDETIDEVIPEATRGEP